MAIQVVSDPSHIPHWLTVLPMSWLSEKGHELKRKCYSSVGPFRAHYSSLLEQTRHFMSKLTLDKSLGVLLVLVRL